jgi:hypothetical protein
MEVNIVAEFEALFEHLPGGTEEYHKTLQSMVHGVN